MGEDMLQEPTNELLINYNSDELLVEFFLF
jgi:hypothetical protein